MQGGLAPLRTPAATAAKVMSCLESEAGLAFAKPSYAASDVDEDAKAIWTAVVRPNATNVASDPGGWQPVTGARPQPSEQMAAGGFEQNAIDVHAIIGLASPL